MFGRAVAVATRKATTPGNADGWAEESAARRQDDKRGAALNAAMNTVGFNSNDHKRVLQVARAYVAFLDDAEPQGELIAIEGDSGL